MRLYCYLLLINVLLGCGKKDEPILLSPNAEFSIYTSPELDVPIQFLDKSIDSDGKIIEWKWDFGNGAFSDEPNPTSTYTTFGSYNVSLTITDNDGLANEITKPINFIEENLPPVLDFELSFSDPISDTSLFVGSKIKLMDNSTDPNNDIITSTWSVNGVTIDAKEFNIDERGDVGIYIRSEDEHGYFSDTTVSLHIVGVDMPAWKEGYFDIHHINTARGDASFFIFPDGTTLLFDAGDKHVPGGSEPDFPIHPNSSKVPGEWIAHYIEKVTSHYRQPAVDYAVISHFHVDHMGKINDSSPRSNLGDYRLGGITQVGELIPIHKITDRGYPNYDFPVDLKKDRDDTDNYVKFINYYQSQNLLVPFEFRVGARDQIIPMNTDEWAGIFSVRNVYANGMLWSGRSDEIEQIPFSKPLVDESGDWNGNPLSICLKFEFGDFDYFTGGDITGKESWPDYDIESAVGERIGAVDAVVLNHHGFHDATNNNFLSLTQPSVIIQQASNFAHINGEVLGRIRQYGQADLFTSNMSAFHSSTPSLRSEFKSISGHTVLRVADSGKSFKIFVLNDNSENMPAMKEFGPYNSKK